MRLKYVKSLNNGSLQIKPLSFWSALGLSFLFDFILMWVRTPIDNFSIVMVTMFSNIPIEIFDTINIVTTFLYQYGGLLLLIVLINNNIQLTTKHEKSEGTRKFYVYGAVLIISYIFITYGVFDYILYSMQSFDVGFIELIEEYIETTPALILMIESVVVAPIFEEILYRGILLNGLLKRYSYRRAIIYSAMIFGIAHMNVPQGINAFLIAIIIGAVYYYTKSLYVCMFMHFANNFLVNFIYYPQNEMVKIIAFIVIPILGAIMMIMAFNALKKNRVR